MKKIFRTIFLLTLVINLRASAQTFEVPKDYKLKSQKDYVKYEPEVVKIADWLMRTPLATEPAKREAATQFILVWAQGTKDVVIELKQSIMNLSDANPQLGFIYMASFCKYAIQHKADFDKTQANFAALKDVIAKYEAEPTHKRDDDVENLIKLDNENKLGYWVVNEFTQQ
jgi:hypothetical protein